MCFFVFEVGIYGEIVVCYTDPMKFQIVCATKGCDLLLERESGNIRERHLCSEMCWQV